MRSVFKMVSCLCGQVEKHGPWVPARGVAKKAVAVQPETDSVLSSVKWILKNVARSKGT